MSTPRTVSETHQTHHQQPSIKIKKKFKITIQNLVDRVVDELSYVDLLILVVEDLIGQPVRALGERVDELLQDLQVESRLDDLPVRLPGFDVAGYQTLAQEVVHQPVEEDLPRVLGATQDGLQVVRLEKDHVGDYGYPEPADWTVELVSLVGHDVED